MYTSTNILKSEVFRWKKSLLFAHFFQYLMYKNTWIFCGQFWLSFLRKDTKGIKIYMLPSNVYFAQGKRWLANLNLNMPLHGRRNKNNWKPIHVSYHLFHQYNLPVTILYLVSPWRFAVYRSDTTLEQSTYFSTFCLQRK